MPEIWAHVAIASSARVRRDILSAVTTLPFVTPSRTPVIHAPQATLDPEKRLAIGVTVYPVIGRGALGPSSRINWLA